jgi:hypothetical protein
MWAAFRRPGLAAAALLAAGLSPAAAQPAFEIRRVDVPPRLADYLDGEPRPEETAVTGFMQREPGDGVPISQETTAYLSYDDHNLYVVFVCRDTEPGRIRARLTRREGFLGDDAVGVVLDTFHDRRRGYLFLVNPLGIQLDGLVAEGQNDDFSFDTLWHSQGRLTDFGYVVWIAIPFRSLRFADGPEQTWGMALGRIIPRTNETAFWPSITRRAAGFLDQFATLEGLERISPGRNLQFIPYGTFAGARLPDAAGAGFATQGDGRVGLDAKMVLRDAYAVDLALNPDFSQVESDEPQVTINQRFEVFFPERRPFFIENATYFDTPIQLFFSRRIVDPQFGGRVTGKAGGWAVGALIADDRAEARLLGAAAPLSRAGLGVVRAARDVGEQSSLGLSASSREFGDSYGRVVSVDTRTRLSARWVARGQAAFSAVQGLDGVSRSGPALYGQLRREGRTFPYTATYRDYAPGFRAPLGFVRRTDIRELFQEARVSRFPQESRLLRYGSSVTGVANWSHAGVLQDWSIRPTFGIDMRGPTFVRLSHDRSMERFQEIDLHKSSSSIFFHSEWIPQVSGFASVAWGREINYFPPAPLPPFVGDARVAIAGVTLRPLAQFRLDQTYIYSGLKTGRGPPGAVAPGAQIFENHLLRTRASYQFTRAFSLRAIVDYTSVGRRSDLIAAPGIRRAVADLLLTWLLNPGTAVYLGYTDQHQGAGVDLRRDGLSGEPTPALHPVGRQVFVKASYLLRF